MSINSRRFVVPLSLLLALASACAARGKASVSASGDTPEAASSPSLAPKAADPDASATAPHLASGSKAEAAPTIPPEPPRHDPKAVREAIDRTASPVDERRPRLGLRLGVVDQGPDAPWMLVLVNRGTEPLRVGPDLRSLVLEVTPPQPAVDPDKPKRKPPAPKLVTCQLPGELVPKEENPALSFALEPGEGIVDSFDPRLYCLSTKGKSPLVPDASVVVRLGFQEKTKPVWRKGKRELVVLEQSAPFLAHRDVPEGSLPEAPAETPPKPKAELEPGAAPHSDSNAIKLVLSAPVILGAEYAPPPPPPVERLDLELARGSDARTEAEATVTLSLVNRSKKKERVFFRRELVSFEISGPQGLVECQPGPDGRAPDGGAVSTLKPGGRISATSRLIELCPQGSLRAPGLYLVHARFDAIEGRDPQAPATFSGRLVSGKPVTIRVRRGWGELPAQREPERIQIGTP